jgi:hypothetical protein
MATVAPKSTGTAEHEPATGGWLDAWREVRSAVARMFFDVQGRLDIRELWSDGLTHRFRLNWWRYDQGMREQRIWRSAFVTVMETDNGPEVREETVRLAA